MAARHDNLVERLACTLEIKTRQVLLKGDELLGRQLVARCVPQLPDRPPFQIVQADINPQRSQEKFPPIPLERTTETGLTHKAGSLSMPRGAAADSATSGFVICLEDTPSLDVGSKRYPDGQGFAAFGRVVKGLDVVRRIQQQPTNDKAETAMGRQSLTPPVTITRMSRMEGQK